MNWQFFLGNFALILFVLMIITGVIWCIDLFVLAKQRRAQADAALAEFEARKAEFNSANAFEQARTALKVKLLKQPLWIEYSGSFFPVIAIVFCLRSFLYEPFKIPSSSMEPTLIAGDLILVNKFVYGIRLPIIHKKIIALNDPQRGDVMVFRYPQDLSLDYIKRVVGIPGDRVVYKNKRLTINGQKLTYTSLPDYLDEQNWNYYQQWHEDLTGAQHRILTDERAPDFVVNPDTFPQHELCSYDAEGFACTVPAGHYFVMGDNRDSSLDSRYWGFVPDQDIVGQAFFIWMNLSHLKRIGRFH